MWELGRLYRRLARADRFDVAHQLNPVDVGVSLALTGDRDAAGARPLLLRLGAVGAGRGRTGRPADAACEGRRAAQQRRATMLLLSTPDAAGKVERAAPGGRSCASCRTASTSASGTRRPGAGRQTVLFLANLEVRKGIHVLLDAFESLAARLPDARLQVAGDGHESETVRRRVRNRRHAPASSCSATLTGSTSWR